MDRNSSLPPDLAVKILSRMNRQGEEFAVLGDLSEEFLSLGKKKGKRRARIWYWRQVLVHVPVFLKESLYWSCQMFKNYLVVTWRNVKRHKGFSFINTAGLAVGMAACFLILQWVRDEIGFNKFHKNVDNIYWVIAERANHRGEFTGTTPVPLAEPLRRNYPEISKVVRFNFRRDVVARRGEKVFTDWQGAYVDPEVFDVFTFPLAKGEAESALRELNSVVLTETSAQKLFAGVDPVGQMMEIEGDLVQVTGLLRDIPKNSDIQADYFRPFLSMKEIVKNRAFIWNWFSCRTFLLLKEGADPAVVRSNISGLLNTNRPWSKDPLDMSLFALKDMHLRWPPGGGPIKSVAIFTLVAVMILLIACINFTNLSTARSAKRAKEVGLRKVVGSRRSDLILQFFMESLFFALCSAVFAVLLALFGMPFFNQLTQKSLRVDLGDVGWILGIIGTAVLTGIAAGAYPALALSSFRPVDVMKGNLLLGQGRKRGAATGARFRQGMVVTQFVLSIGLIICALSVSQQLDYMRNGDMGFDRDNLVRIAIPQKHAAKSDILKTALARSPHIAGATAHGFLNQGGKIEWDNAPRQEDLLQRLSTETLFGMVDFDYLATQRMTIVAGRDFSRDFASDAGGAYLLNEEAVKRWDFKDPVGKRFALVGAPGIVIGVYKNEHFGLKDDLLPCVLYLSPHTNWDRYNYLTVRLKTGFVPEALEDIQKAWKSTIADVPCEYRFVDEMIGALYRSEELMSGLIKAFTVLAVAISCLGLFGMVSFMAQQKTKEIGVRKVLGASVFRVVFLMSRETVRWVLLANVIAWPAAFFAMRSWLSDYPYRIKIGLEVFLVSGLAALAVAMMTIIGQAVKAALANPTESLRCE